MSSLDTLHFTLGPVQGFVAQARKTRDLWAGSFLLSYLAGHAMMAVKKNGGHIIFPYVENEQGGLIDPLLSAIADPSTEKSPVIGSLPNRFKARIPHGFDPEWCTKAVNQAWSHIAEGVWTKYVASVAELGYQSQDIWERQVQGFWDMAWVVAEEDNVLERRKNWRTYVPSSETGDMCTVMSHLQELSGYSRNHRSGRTAQEYFWSALRDSVRSELDPNERLSAVALIKRLFPLASREVIGWEVPTHFPSTIQIAATDWIVDQVKSRPTLAAQYAIQVKGPSVGTVTMAPDVQHRRHLRIFEQLDANYFDTNFLRRKYDNDPQVENLVSVLKQFGEPPGHYYALLVMDGDRLGELLPTLGGPLVSRALAQFTEKVDGIVTRYDGTTIYAGGDDVLALVPLSQVLLAAQDIRQVYQTAFSSQQGDHYASISAAIVFAHHHAPLQGIVRYGHRLLDTVAKDKVGRDGLALAIWNSGGVALHWGAKWDVVITPAGDNRFMHVVKRLQKIGDSRDFSSQLIYKIRDLVGRLGGSSEVLTQAVVEALLWAEYKRSRETESMVDTEAREALRELISLADARSGGSLADNLPDVALMARFLATRGVENA